MLQTSRAGKNRGQTSTEQMQKDEFYFEMPPSTAESISIA